MCIEAANSTVRRRLSSAMALWLLAGLLCCAKPAFAQKSLTAYPRGQAKITLDGELKEAIWQKAPVSDPFVERSPVPGAKPPVRTEVRVLVDPDGLWVSVVSFLAQGEEPRALELLRDSFGLFSDDAISLKIDVRHDTRTTLGFVTNPAGAKLDYVALENGQNFRREFDANWSVATKVFKDRWVAEFHLPAGALGLPDTSGNRIVGLNITRDHNHRLATYDWSAIPPEFGPSSAMFYGDLLGTDSLGGGRPYSLIPYGIATYNSEGSDNFEGQIGGEARMRLGTDVWAELTVLTDFAQVDLDDPVINLDRFALFFPERRPFFLSGIEFFELGQSGAAQLFFSRRIGLSSRGEVIPLWAGLKSYGTIGDWRFGAMTALTGDEAETPSQSFTVLRLRHTFGEYAHIGVMSTLRLDAEEENGLELGNPNFGFGLDGTVRGFKRRLELSGFWSMSDEWEDGAQPGHAGRILAAWKGFRLQPSVEVLMVDKDFAPAMGFVRRQNQVSTTSVLRWIERPAKWGVQRVTGEVQANTIHGFNQEGLLTQKATAEINVLLRNGFSFNLLGDAHEDYVDEEANVLGRTIAPGTYEGYYLLAEISSPGGRNPQATLRYTHNTGFFDGVAHTLNISGSARFGPHVQFSASAQLGQFEWKENPETIETLTLKSRLIITPNTKLSIDLSGQTNSLQERAIALARIRYRYLPGSDIFLVYREDIDYAEQQVSSERTVSLKATYRYDGLL